MAPLKVVKSQPPARCSHRCDPPSVRALPTDAKHQPTRPLSPAPPPAIRGARKPMGGEAWTRKPIGPADRGVSVDRGNPSGASTGRREVRFGEPGSFGG